MRIHRNLAVLDAAEQVVVEVVRLTTPRSSRLLFKAQLLRSAQSISANIGEAFGRGTKADRNRSLAIARAEAEETIRHLRANHLAKRIEDRTYWRLHNRLVAITRMLSSLMSTKLAAPRPLPTRPSRRVAPAPEGRRAL
jgi:four helix bundle protein